MTPHQLSKSGSEHAHQVALFAYCAVAVLHGFQVADYWAETGLLHTHGPGGQMVAKPVPELRWLHAIHNQGHGDAVRGAKAKAEGVKAGVADIFLPVSNISIRANRTEPGFYGLYIEMKKPKRELSKGGISEDQFAFAMFVEHQGYQWNVCYSWQEAVEVIKQYLS